MIFLDVDNFPEELIEKIKTFRRLYTHIPALWVCGDDTSDFVLDPERFGIFPKDKVFIREGACSDISHINDGDGLNILDYMQSHGFQRAYVAGSYLRHHVVNLVGDLEKRGVSSWIIQDLSEDNLEEYMRFSQADYDEMLRDWNEIDPKITNRTYLKGVFGGMSWGTKPFIP